MTGSTVIEDGISLPWLSSIIILTLDEKGREMLQRHSNLRI